MTGGELSGSSSPDEIARLEGLGFERIASSNLVLGGGLLVEKNEDGQRLYAPFGRVDSERVEAIRISDTFMGRDANGLCVQVMQQPTPEQAARWGNDKQFLELTSNGSGGGMRDEGDEGRATARLVDLSQKHLVDQLQESGFAQEATENETSIMRYRGAQGEMVTIVEGNHLKGVFVPTDQMERSHRNLDPQQLEIVGIGEFEGFLDSDTVQTGVRVSNGWAEFIINPNHPSWPQQPRIVREPTLEELNIDPLSQVAEQSGFIQGGINSTETIRQLTSINGIPVRQLEVDMQPLRMSGAGFLGEGESLIDVLAHDNETVLVNGLTHQELALPLRYIQRLYEVGLIGQTSGHQMAGVNDITIGGHPYTVGVSQWRGIQDSPFRDRTGASYDLHVLNLETGHAISASALISEMVGRYGFYEGLGTGYRTEPESIIKTFTHLNERVAGHSEPADPIVGLTSGQSNEAVLTNDDQVNRFRRLFAAALPSIREANVTIRFSSCTDLLSFLTNESNTTLVPYIDTEVLQTLEPSPLQLRGYSSVKTFVEVLGQLHEKAKSQIIDLVSTIDTSERESWMGNTTLQEIIEASIKEVDGAYVRQTAAGLIEKVDYTEGEFVAAFYKAAGGRYSEWVTQKIGEPRGTRQSKVELDEDRARALSDLFGNQVMPVVAAFREAMQIDANQPADEQIIAFLKKYHTLEKAQGIANHFLVKQNRPDLKLSDWLRISDIVDSMQPETRVDEVSESDREFLSTRDFSLTDLIDARKLYPGGNAETVVLQLYNGALERSRRESEITPAATHLTPGDLDISSILKRIRGFDQR